MKKSERQRMILAIIQEKEIGTQEELVAELSAKGLEVTQATISRDIAGLQLIKEPGSSGSFYKLPQKLKVDIGMERTSLEGVIRTTVTRIDRADNLLVIHTLPGGAATVAFYVDEEKLAGVLGTIAGDDTILIILGSREAAAELQEQWKKIQR